MVDYAGMCETKAFRGHEPNLLDREKREVW